MMATIIFGKNQIHGLSERQLENDVIYHQTKFGSHHSSPYLT